MIDGKIDTKKIFSESLIDLLASTSFDKITVQKIAENCQYTRQTFYLHFRDKYDLCGWFYKQQNDQILNSYFDLISWQEILSKMLYGHITNKEVIRAFADFSGKNSLHEYIYEYTYETYLNISKRHTQQENLPIDFLFAVKLYSHGSAEMTYSWITHGMKETPYFMAKGLVDSMPSKIRNVIC